MYFAVKPSDPSASLGTPPKVQSGMLDLLFHDGCHWRWGSGDHMSFRQLCVFYRVPWWCSGCVAAALAAAQGSQPDGAVVPEGFSCPGLLQWWDQNRLMTCLKKRVYLSYQKQISMYVSITYSLQNCRNKTLPPACFSQYSKDHLNCVKLRKCLWIWPWRISHRGCALDFVLQLVIAHLSKICQQMDSIFFNA